MPLLLLLQGGTEDSGERAHVLGHEVVALHEALHRPHPVALAVTHAPGDLRLEVEGEPVFGAAGQVVQMAAHGPQEAARAQEPDQRLPGEQPLPDHLGRIVPGLDEAGDPQQRLQVAQAALALLDVGLEHEAGIAHALMALVALGELGLGERGPATGHDLPLVALAQLREEVRRAPEQARLEQGRLDGEVVLRELDGLGHRADRLPDLQPQVPQLVEQELRDLLDMGGALVGAQEQEVDVRAGRQLLAAIAADRDHRQLLAGGRVGAAVEVGSGEIERALDEPVHQAAELAMDDLGAPAALEMRLDLDAAMLQLVAQLIEQPRAGIDGRVLRDLVAQVLWVEQR